MDGNGVQKSTVSSPEGDVKKAEGWTWIESTVYPAHEMQACWRHANQEGAGDVESVKIC